MYGRDGERTQYEKDYRIHRSVIGGVETSQTGNIVLRVGRENYPGGPWTATEHVVLTPAEARALMTDVAVRLP